MNQENQVNQSPELAVPTIENPVDKELMDLIGPIAAKYGALPEHWIHGSDESLSYCYDCAEQELTALLAADPGGDYCIGGGYGSGGDSQAFCETCHSPLDNSFTEYAAEQELDHFEEYGFDPTSPADCHSFMEVIYTKGCGNDDLNERIDRMGAEILAKTQGTKRIMRAIDDAQ